MQWETDWELRARMAAVLFALAVLLGAFAVAMHWVLTDAFAAFSAFLFGGDAPVVVGDRLGVGLLAVLFVAAAVSELLVSEKLTGEDTDLRSSGDAPAELRTRLARLAQTADLPSPKLRTVETETPKAYTTGVLPGNATIVVSTGLVGALDDEQLDAVLAHELAHVRNRDAAVVTAASLVEIVGRWLLEAFERPASDDPETDPRRRESPTKRFLYGNPVSSFLWLFYAVAVRPVAWGFWWVGRGLSRLLSQHREYAADRGAAAITGSPAAVASALATLDRAAREHPETDRRAREAVRAGFYVVPVPESDDDFDPSEYTGFAVVAEHREPTTLERFDAAATDATAAAIEEANDATDFPTHPPTGERIARLRELEAQSLSGSPAN